jgi:hypothetical protein
LHRSGQVIFDDYLEISWSWILDWALGVLYAVLDRHTALLEIRRQAGALQPSDARRARWRKYAVEHQTGISNAITPSNRMRCRKSPIDIHVGWLGNSLMLQWRTLLWPVDDASVLRQAGALAWRAEHPRKRRPALRRRHNAFARNRSPGWLPLSTTLYVP